MKKQSAHADRFGARNRTLPGRLPADKHPLRCFVARIPSLFLSGRFDGTTPLFQTNLSAGSRGVPVPNPLPVLDVMFLGPQHRRTLPSGDGSSLEHRLIPSSNADDSVGKIRVALG